MLFVANGPDIPVEILRAQEQDRLVLFCGAGISIPAGLPDFGGLVDKVYAGLGTTPSREEHKELSGPQPAFDRVLNLLEGPNRFSGSQVRQQVAKALATPADPFLDTHRAVIKLSRDRAGHLRLVTTNFDVLFQAAEPGVPVTAAPLLPVPKPHKWDQLVHLHGRLDPADQDGTHLVLTSADFGIAYLVERWASRFVSELFRHYTVLFVGYTVDDPPMRYLTDAIAAERRRGDRVQPAFALAGHAAGQREEVGATWAAKGITPVLYENSDGHGLLHRTLKEWSRIWAGGLSSKLALVADLAQKDPGTLPPEALSQFCWAVSDESGSMARELARPERPGKLAWLQVLEKQGALETLPGSGAPSSIALVDDGHTTRRVASLNPVRHGLAAWLAEHASDSDLARWVVGKGGHLHPTFRDFIRRKLGDATAMPPYLRKVWLALTGSVRLCRRPDAYDRFGFYKRLPHEAWGPALRTEILASLAPCLEVRPSWTSVVPASDDEEAEERRETVSSILSFDCELEAGDGLSLMLDELAARSDWSAILADMAFDLTHHLREALDFQAALDGASEAYDPSYIQHPSIVPHPQNHHFHGWTRLIDLVHQAYHALLGRDPERASSLVSVWCSVPYPLFRRLVLYAARIGRIPSAATLLELLPRDPKHWLWSIPAQAELFAALPILWTDLDERGRSRLVTILIEGPPRDIFRDDLEPGTLDSARDEMVWDRLARLVRVGAALPAEAASRLAAIEVAHPQWRLTGAEREDFPSWGESWSGFPTDFSAEALRALPDEELLAVLLRHESNRRGLLEAWHEVAKTDRPRAIRLLNHLLDEGHLDPAVWSRGLAAYREIGDNLELKRGLLGLLERLPTTLASDPQIVRPAADAIKSIAHEVPDEIRSTVLTRWDALFDHALSVEAHRTQERVSDAINQPAGILAEALFEVLRSRPLERNKGIADDIRPRLERIVAAEGAAASLARVIAASRLPLLHDLDAEWTRQFVVPLFDWQDADEAQGAWQGFLWSPWVRPSLWVDLKPHFLAACDHVAALGRSAPNFAGLLASMAIEGADALSAAEARECLRQLGAEGRQDVAAWLWQKLKQAGTQAPVLWRDSIGPWLAAAWPVEPGLRDPRTSERLAWAATLTRDLFPAAVHALRELVGPIQYAHMLLDEMRKNELTTTAPEACLELLHAVTPDHPPPGFGPLRDFLEKLHGVKPALDEDPRFQRLHNIAIQAGL